jgi:sulfur-oxidizing protein SoxB
MTGEEIKGILEDMADNLFNPDPYYRQGGDMVRVGGMNYDLDPTEKIGRRVSAMALDGGDPVEAGKRYKVAGWATVSAKSSGPPIWEVVVEYLRAEKVVRLNGLNTPKLRNVRGNPGIEDYPT